MLRRVESQHAPVCLQQFHRFEVVETQTVVVVLVLLVVVLVLLVIVVVAVVVVVMCWLG